MKRILAAALAATMATGIACSETGPTNPATGTPEWETVDRHCDFLGNEQEQGYQGPCVERFDYQADVHSVAFRGREYSIDDYEPMRHELPWMFVTIDGRPAAAYQHHRSWTSYATEDLQVVLDVCDTADQFGGCT